MRAGRQRRGSCAAWAISVAKSKVMSTPASAGRTACRSDPPSSGRCSLPPSQPRPARPASPPPARRPRRAWTGRSRSPWRARRDQVAQRHVVDQHHQPDGAGASSARRALRHVAGDDRDLALEVDAPGFVRHADGIARPEEASRSRPGTSGDRSRRLSGMLGAPRLAHQLHMVHVGRAVRPLVGARQGRGAVVLVEADARHGRRSPALGDVGEARASRPSRPARPAGSARRDRPGRSAQIARDDDEPAVAAAVLQACELHGRCFTGSGPSRDARDRSASPGPPSNRRSRAAEALRPRREQRELLRKARLEHEGQRVGRASPASARRCSLCRRRGRSGPCGSMQLCRLMPPGTKPSPWRRTRRRSAP